MLQMLHILQIWQWHYMGLLESHRMNKTQRAARSKPREMIVYAVTQRNRERSIHQDCLVLRPSEEHTKSWRKKETSFPRVTAAVAPRGVKI